MNGEKKALEFDEIASNIFAPIYPAIASSIIEKTKIDEGICIDIGCGGGHLGIEISKITRMYVNLLDISPYSLNIANNRIKSKGLKNRMKTVLGDVHNIPFENNTVQLIVSRGSIWFWENQVKALTEIYRVLSKGGFAYIGGGFGNDILRREVFEKMENREPNWEERRKGFIKDNNAEKLDRIATEANIPYYNIIDDDSGLWIVMNKL